MTLLLSISMIFEDSDGFVGYTDITFLFDQRCPRVVDGEYEEYKLSDLLCLRM